MRLKRIIFGSSIFLISCSTYIEHARIEIMPDLSSSIQILIGDKSKTALEQYETKAKECGAITKVFGDTEKFFLQANVQLKNRDEIDAIVRCSRSSEDAPKLAISTTDSYFAKKYQLDFEMKSGAVDIFGKNFPSEFSFTLPGKISDIQDNSSVKFYDVIRQQNGDNRIVINIKMKNGINIKDFEQQLINKYCEGQKENCNKKIPESEITATIKISILSEVSKYDLQTWLNILGILFGSGVSFEVWRRFFSSNTNTNNNPP